MRYALIALVIVSALSGAAVAADLQPGSGEILVRGLIESASASGMTMTATAVRAAGAAEDTMLKERVQKQVLLSASTRILLSTGAAGTGKDLVAGAEVAAVGPNQGRGQALPARAIMVFLPERPPAGSLSPTDSAPPPPPPPGNATGAAQPSPAASWAKWNDPAGFSYEYPKDWSSTASPGANPVSFLKEGMVLSVRRLPADQTSTPAGRALTAMQSTSAEGSRQGWQVSEGRTMMAAQNGFKLTMQGKMTAQQVAQFLGAKPMAPADAGESNITMVYAGAPPNTGRESFALEVGIAAPAGKSFEASDVLSRVQRSLTFGASQAREAPAFIGPMRVANTVQIENTMKQIGTALQTYFVDNDDVVPPNWTALEPYLGGAFGGNIRNGWPNWQVGPIQLLQPGKRLSELGDPSATALAKADGPGFSVLLYADGHVLKKMNR